MIQSIQRPLLLVEDRQLVKQQDVEGRADG